MDPVVNLVEEAYQEAIHRMLSGDPILVATGET
jgi:hypothetical protein